MREIGIDCRASGSGITGCYSYWREKEKIAHHQFEYEEYWEMDEKIYNKYIQIAEMK